MSNDKNDKKDRKFKEKRLRAAERSIKKAIRMGLLDSALIELKSAVRTEEMKIPSNIVDSLAKAFLKFREIEKANETIKLGASPKVCQMVKNEKLKFAEWNIKRNIERGRLEAALNELGSVVWIDEIKVPSDIVDTLAKAFLKIRNIEKAKRTLELGASPEVCCIVLKAYIDYLKDQCLGLLNKN